MQIVNTFFFCCLLAFGQQEQKSETGEKKPAVGQVKKEPVKKSARDLRRAILYEKEVWCRRAYHYFFDPEYYVKISGINSKDLGVERDILWGRIQREMLNRLRYGGCEW